VLSAATALGQLATGVASGLQFNPIAAAVAATLAAALSGYRRAPRSRLWWSAGVLLAGWAAGDGLRIAGSSSAPLHLAAWAIVGLAIGYVVPAVLGAYVGRQVHRGTGYLSAGAVALMLVPALSAVVDPIATALMRTVR
jgi:hypothetical protein